MPVINDQKSLDAFRAQWTAPEIFKFMKGHPLLYVNWAVGVGKSHLMDDLIEDAVTNRDYDLIVAMVPTRKVLDERRWIKNPPSGIKIINLQPRPSDQCAPTLDALLRGFEQRGMMLLGRHEVCGKLCQNKTSCSWLGQYGSKNMAGAQVVFGTQAHLQRDPLFVHRLKSWTGAEKPLLLLDEANFLSQSRKVVVTDSDLSMHQCVLDEIIGNQ